MGKKDWTEHWDNLASENELSSMGRSGASLQELFIYINSICYAFDNICSDDVILD